jgi:hypothetical protein
LTTGEPVTPRRRWTVLYNDALLAWLEVRPAQWRVDRVLEWIDELRDAGPPPDAVPVDPDDDVYLAAVPGTATDLFIVATFRVISDEREQLILLKLLE